MDTAVCLHKKIINCADYFRKERGNMCTAISVTVGDNYFGRNLDYEHTFGEKIVITPRNYVFDFRNGVRCDKHYAIIGMALPMNEYPLYFDATNEKGLSMAGLNFPENAIYNKNLTGRENVASFEFIPWILTQCKDISDAEALIGKINITNECFEKDIIPTPLHWMISDKNKSLTVEQTKDGYKTTILSTTFNWYMFKHVHAFTNFYQRG